MGISVDFAFIFFSKLAAVPCFYTLGLLLGSKLTSSPFPSRLEGKFALKWVWRYSVGVGAFKTSSPNDGLRGGLYPLVGIRFGVRSNTGEWGRKKHYRANRLKSGVCHKKPGTPKPT